MKIGGSRFRSYGPRTPLIVLIVLLWLLLIVAPISASDSTPQSGFAIEGLFVGYAPGVGIMLYADSFRLGIDYFPTSDPESLTLVAGRVDWVPNSSTTSFNYYVEAAIMYVKVKDSSGASGNVTRFGIGGGISTWFDSVLIFGSLLYLFKPTVSKSAPVGTPLAAALFTFSDSVTATFGIALRL
jgi:hypothetical protein